MPYTPPAGSAVTFNFYGTTYSPPAGTSIVFNFGSSGGGGPGATASPSGMRQAIETAEEWFRQPSPPRFAPVPQVSGIIPFSPPAMSGLALACREETPWMFSPQRVTYVPTPVTTRRRTVILCVT